MPQEIYYQKISQYSQENTCIEVGLQIYWKETPTQMFPCKYWEIPKKTYVEEHLRTPTSEETLRSDWLGLSFWRVAFKNIQT